MQTAVPACGADSCDTRLQTASSQRRQNTNSLATIRSVTTMFVRKPYRVPVVQPASAPCSANSATGNPATMIAQQRQSRTLAPCHTGRSTIVLLNTTGTLVSVATSLTAPKVQIHLFGDTTFVHEIIRTSIFLSITIMCDLRTLVRSVPPQVIRLELIERPSVPASGSISNCAEGAAPRRWRSRYCCARCQTRW